MDISGVGLGLRREFLKDFAKTKPKLDWIEITPENWLELSYGDRALFEEAIDGYPIVAHGVSLSLGSIDSFDRVFLSKLKEFFDRYKISYYSEHISFSVLNSVQTYELLPLPMTKNMVNHLSKRVKEVEDFLERELILENASYYISPYAEMREIDFINEVLEVSGSKMLLDVNNVFVNSVNHNFCPYEFISQIKPSSVAYIHIAGHLKYPNENLLLDTHGESVCKKVWKLLDKSLDLIKAPVMIERDNNIPPLKSLLKECKKLKKMVTNR